MTQSKTDPNTAIQNANAVSYAPWRISSLQSIADGLAASGHQARAVALLDLIQSPADRAYGLASMALRQAEKGSADAPLTAELAWEAAMNARDEVAPSTLGFIAVARGYLGDFAGALQIVNGLSTEARAWPLWCLTEMLVAADKTQEAIGVAESQEDPLPKVYALLGLARGLIEDTAQPKEKQSHQKGQP